MEGRGVLSLSGLLSESASNAFLVGDGNNMLPLEPGVLGTIESRVLRFPGVSGILASMPTRSVSAGPCLETSPRFFARVWYSDSVI